MIGLLQRVERLIASLIERPAEHWFTPQLEPIQIARRLEAAMDAGIQRGTRGVLVPNSYVVALDSASYERFASAATGLQRELEQHLTSTAARQRFRTLDPFGVELKADATLKSGRITVQSAFVGLNADLRDRAASAGQGVPEATQLMPVAAPPATTSANRLALLEVMGQYGVVRTAPLRGTDCTIGRATDNTLVLLEVAVSRYHAVLRHRDGGYEVEDLGSTNGIQVNGKQVERAHLKDGDRLIIGSAHLVFRVRQPSEVGATPQHPATTGETTVAQRGTAVAASA